MAVRGCDAHAAAQLEALRAMHAAELAALKTQFDTAGPSATPSPAQSPPDSPERKPGMGDIGAMSCAEAAAELSALHPDVVARQIKPLPVRHGADILLALPPGFASAVLSSKVLSKPESAALLAAMRDGTVSAKAQALQCGECAAMRAALAAEKNARAADADAARAAQDWAQWDGQPMGNLIKPRLSKLEKQQAAWKAAERAHAAKQQPK